MFGFETHEQSVFCSTDYLGEMCDEWFSKSCIGWFEALNGCSIGPKPWDRIDIIFEIKIGAVVCGYGLFGCIL